MSEMPPVLRHVDPFIEPRVYHRYDDRTRRSRYDAVLVSSVWHCRHRHPTSDKAWDCAIKQLRRQIALEFAA